MLSVDERGKRILLVPDSLFWVTGRIASELSKELRKFSHEPIICSGPVLLTWLRTNPELVEYFDIVHFLTPHLATQFKDIFLGRCAFVSTIHHIEDDRSTEPAPYSDAIMTVSQQWHNVLVNRGISEKKLVMVQNGIDSNLFHPVDLARKNKLRKKFGLPTDVFIVGFSAKKTSDTCDRKGIDTLSGLITGPIFSKHGGVGLFVRGPGWNELIVGLKNQGGQVYYCPFAASDKDLAESYQVLDAFIITSRIEGGPVPLLEAMACGLPVITTRVGIALEIVEDNINGLITDFNAPAQILQKLEFLLENRDQIRAIGNRARQTIVEKLQWKDTVKNISELYSIAENNYRGRTHGFIKNKNYKNEEIESTVNSLKKWISMREKALFAKFLNAQGAFGAAVAMADKAIFESPYNWKLVREMGTVSKSRVPYWIVGWVINSFRRRLFR